MDARQIEQAYEEIFTTEAGQIVLGDLERFFGYSTHPMGQSDQPHHAFIEIGGRNVLTHIARRLSVRTEQDPNQIMGD